MIKSLVPRPVPLGARFENLAVTLGGKNILHDINAVAPPGGATVIVGPNGAGKTTLLRCFLGKIPHSGNIYYFDKGGKRVKTAIIGYVPQQLRIDATMPLRVYEFLSIGQRRPLWLGCSRASRAHAREMLAMVGGEKLEKQRMGNLSGGEMRRVLLAAALGRKPDIVALDEAEAGVDYRGERLFWELLDKSRKEYGFTLIMVSHNLPMAAHYATHIIAIKETVVAEGSPRDTLTAKKLLELFGVPIHLYPMQCVNPGPICEQCGAFGNLPYWQGEEAGGLTRGQSPARRDMDKS